jgi:hypothetical protein
MTHSVHGKSGGLVHPGGQEHRELGNFLEIKNGLEAKLYFFG